jgi:hypothetical protein
VSCALSLALLSNGKEKNVLGERKSREVNYLMEVKMMTVTWFLT